MRIEGFCTGEMNTVTAYAFDGAFNLLYDKRTDNNIVNRTLLLVIYNSIL